jgi:hypothetical protein
MPGTGRASYAQDNLSAVCTLLKTMKFIYHDQVRSKSKIGRMERILEGIE